MKQGKKILAAALTAALLLTGCGKKQDLPEQTVHTTAPTIYIIEGTDPVLETTVPEEPVSLDTVPLFFQTDYPDIEYGDGTVETDGCSVASLAMVATYLTERWYYPDELAYYFGTYGDNNIQRLEYGIEMMQLPCKKAVDWNDVSAALKDGGVVIALMNENSIFTEAQHFIVLRGLTEEGKVLVNDPFGPNHEIWDLKYGFDNGFTQSQIIAGYSGGWIFHKEDMPEEPFLYQDSLPPYIRRGVSRHSDESEKARRSVVELAPDEERLLAQMLWVLAAEETEQCQQAIVEVVINRLASVYYPDTVQQVLMDRKLFPEMGEIELAMPGPVQFSAIERALEGPYVLTKGITAFQKLDPGAEKRDGQIGSFLFGME